MLRIDGPWDGIATLTLDRPERKNALSVELRDRISDVLDALAADEAVRVVVLTGEGDVFSAGFDLKEFERAVEDPAFGEQLWASSDRYHRTVLRVPAADRRRGQRSGDRRRVRPRGDVRHPDRRRRPRRSRTPR